MKNYYEVLEISENASQEVVERVYKLFAKKYHPDLNPDNPKEAEEKFKEITEAYEILSDESQRRSYDEKLNLEKKKAEAVNNQQNHSSAYSSSYNYYSNPNDTEKRVRTGDNVSYSNSNQQPQGFAQDVNMYNDIARQNMEKELQKEREYQIKKAYNDAYVEILKRLGIKVVYKKSFKDRVNDLKNILLLILIFAIVIFIIWQIPYTRGKVTELLNAIKQLIPSKPKIRN